MKFIKNTLVLLSAAFLLIIVNISNAADHYGAGSEGAEIAVKVPSGFYYRMYNFYIEADELLDADGNAQPINFNLKVLTSLNRFIWLSDHKFFGCELGMDILIPIVHVDNTITVDTPGGQVSMLDDATTGIGDIIFEPLIWGRHWSQGSLVGALGFVIPTGDYGTIPNKVYPGYGYWSMIFTLGGTVFFDKRKVFSISMLNRYLIHAEQNETDITPGDELVCEWGIGMTLPPVSKLLFRPGIAGFYEKQVSGDSSGPGKDQKYSKSAIGPEINIFILPPIAFQINLRVLWESGTKNGPEGTMAVLTLTKGF